MKQLVNLNNSRVRASGRLFSRLVILVAILLSFLTTACDPSQAITAEERTYLNLSLDFLGEYQLPKLKFKDTPVGGLSALTYDRQGDRFYALSDDRSQFAPARFYTIKLSLNPLLTERMGLEKVEIEDVTYLRDKNGEPFPQGSLDPEGIALSPKGTIFISSEGIPSKGIAPFIGEFDLKTGQQKQSLRIPDRYLPSNPPKDDQPPRGIQENLGFESLTFEPGSLAAASGDPFRLFTATESALFQDKLPATSIEQTRIRLMHYLIGGFAPPTLVTEHVYLLDPTPSGATDNGLTELITVDTGGHFLSLERSYGLLSGAGAKIFQLATSAATDTSGIPTLKGDLSRLNIVQKRLLLDLSKLGIYLDNLEGMALGPRLPDGTQSLLLVSDDNFNDIQITQFLLFRLKGVR